MADVTKYLIINGPMGCGKTELIKSLRNKFSITELNCKDHLHELTKKYFNVSHDWYWNVYNNRTLKTVPYCQFGVKVKGATALATYLDDPDILSESRIFKRGNDVLFALNIREALIFVSEIVTKPYQGEDYFGRARADLTPTNSTSLYTDDSGGFDDEIPPLTEKLGRDNVLAIRVRGRGDWGKDSRTWLSDEVVNCIDMHNDGAEQDFHNTVSDLTNRWLVGGIDEV